MVFKNFPAGSMNTDSLAPFGYEGKFNPVELDKCLLKILSLLFKHPLEKKEFLRY